MKNLKKILSLTLALAMALSLMTTALAKDTGDFADGDDVSYAEAVDVMATVGVFNGVGDGTNFDPKGTLTREQAAKIITYMVMGQTQADKLVATIAPFADVSADRWSAGAIAYCASEGIMNGTGNGKFNPTGELTGLQFAKMLLVALGYDAEIEEMTGAAWGLATSKLAYAVELDDGMDDINLTEVMTREQAAQMAFTTMKTPMVYYPSKGSTISVNGAVVEFGAQQAQYVTADITTGNNDADNIDDKVLSDNSKLIEFGERYCPDLVKTSEDNALEQPSRKWTYKKDTIGTYAIGEDKIIVVSAKDKTLSDILTGKSYMNYSSSKLASLEYDTNVVHVYLNGAQAAWNTNLSTTLNGVALNKGDVVYTYEDNKGNVEKVVIARYQLAKIDSVATNMSTTEKENGAAYRVKLVDLAGDSVGNTNYYDEYNDDTRLLNGFASATYTADTILAVALKAGDDTIADSYVADIVTGKPTAAKEGESGHITVDGTKYQFVANAGDSLKIAGIDKNFDFDNEYNVYMTKDGYVIGIEGVEATKIDDIYYVTSVYTDTVGGEGRFYAQRVCLADGKVDTVQVEKGSIEILDDRTTSTTPDTDIDGAGTALAGLYTFNDRKYDSVTLGDTNSSAKQNSGNDILTMIPFSDDAIDAAAAKTLYGSAYAAEDFAVNGDTGLLSDGSTLGSKLEKDDTKMTVSGNNYYMNADTQYLAIEGVGSGIDVTFATGGMNVGDTSAQTLVLTDADDTKTVLAFIIAGGSLTGISAASKDVIYVPANTTERYGNDNYRNDLWFMKDGNKVEGAIITTKENQGFYTYAENDGVYKLESGADPITDLISGGDYTYKDESGYGEDLVITSAYDKKNVSYVEIDPVTSVNTLTFNAVKLNGATVTDLRSNSTMKSDVYNTAINSIGDLKDATKVATVTADVYFDEGVTFIAVTAVSEPAPSCTYDYDDPEVATVALVNDMLTAGNDVVINGAWSPSDSVALNLDNGSLTLDSGLTLTDADITVGNGETLTVAGAVNTGSGNITVNGTLTGATTITTTGTVTVDGTVTATGTLTSGEVTLTSGTLTVAGIDTTAGDDNITVTAGTLTSSADITAGSGAIAVNGGSLLAGANDITAGSLTTAATTTVTAKDINADIDVSGTLTATGDLKKDFVAKAGAVVSAKSVDFDQTVTSSALTTGSVTLTGTDAITMPASAVTLGGNWTFAAAVTTDGSNALTVNGKATFGGNLSVAADQMLVVASGAEVVINAQIDKPDFIKGTANGDKVTFGTAATIPAVITSNAAKFFKTGGSPAISADADYREHTFAYDASGTKWVATT